MKYSNISLLFTSLIILTVTHNLICAVDDITGDSGSAQTGSLVLSGGLSGGVFDSTTSTITQHFDFLSLPLTTATKGQIIIGGDPILHYYGTGLQNIFVGSFAGNFTTTAASSTACGGSALTSLTEGNDNTAIGQSSLVNLTEGAQNTAVGRSSGSGLLTGNGNTLIGLGAGSAYVSNESNNIVLGANPGTIDESLTIRIGDGQTQQNCYIDGIYASTVNSDTGLSVFVDDQGKLGTIVSSAQFKEHICDIDGASKPIMKFRGVSFSLKGDPKHRRQFGLIAEEVYKIFPELVVLDKHGKPFAIRYHELPVLMLNEMQKQADRIEKLENTVQKLMKRIEKLEAHK